MDAAHHGILHARNPCTRTISLHLRRAMGRADHSRCEDAVAIAPQDRNGRPGRSEDRPEESTVHAGANADWSGRWR